ncbi:MAG: zinc ribbon domain-containing protein [Thermoanaerobaculia bacterium]
MNDVDKLWELQTVMSQLADREKQMSVKPESFAAIDREYQGASDEMIRLEESHEAMAKERRRVDGELSDQQELLRKYQSQLMQVKNQQQYAAAWKEIDATRKHVKELEERRTGHVDLKSRYDTAHGEWQHSLGDLRAESEQLKKKASEIESTLAEPLRREFHRVFKQRGGIAVSRVINDSCSSCRTRIRPALLQRLKRAEMVACEGCSRILFLEKSSS